MNDKQLEDQINENICLYLEEKYKIKVKLQCILNNSYEMTLCYNLADNPGFVVEVYIDSDGEIHDTYLRNKYIKEITKPLYEVCDSIIISSDVIDNINDSESEINDTCCKYINDNKIRRIILKLFINEDTDINTIEPYIKQIGEEYGLSIVSVMYVTDEIGLEKIAQYSTKMSYIPDAIIDSIRIIDMKSMYYDMDKKEVS